jgi:two-component system phosphate regulon response regulator PhoB
MAYVVVVEDDPDLQFLTRLMLEQDGHTVQVFGTGSEAVAGCAAPAEPLPDVVLLDWMLPEMTGLDVLGHLRADPRTARVPVVMVTALDSPAHVTAAMRAGASDYVVKPYAPADLLGAVGRQVVAPEPGGAGAATSTGFLSRLERAIA